MLAPHKIKIKTWKMRLLVSFVLLSLIATLAPSDAYRFHRSYRFIRRHRSVSTLTTTTTTLLKTTSTNPQTTTVPRTTILPQTTTSILPKTTTTFVPITTAVPTTAKPVTTVDAPYGVASSETWSRLIFADDFNNGASKWQRNWRMGDDSRISPPANKSYEVGCWDPKNTTTSNGQLVMKVEQRLCVDAFGNSYNYATGGASTGNFNFTYGYTEAKIFLPTDANNKIANFPAFWLNGTSNDNGGWPAGGEIDVVEGLSDHINCWHYHFGASSNPQQAGGCPSSATVPSLQSAGGWHTYGVDWAPGKIKFFYDGILVSTQTVGVVSTPMYIALDNAVPARWASTIPSEMKVEYVKVWQH